MVLKPYIQDKADDEYRSYYNQTGGGYNIVPYQGVKFQKGHGGLGSIFSNLFKFAVPIVKKLAKPLGQHALQAGAGIIKDKIAGKSLKEAVQTNLKRTGTNAIKQLVGNINSRPTPNKRRKRVSQKVIKGRSGKAKGSKRERDIFN